MDTFEITSELEGISAALLCIRYCIGDVSNEMLESALFEVSTHVDLLRDAIDNQTGDKLEQKVREAS